MRRLFHLLFTACLMVPIAGPALANDAGEGRGASVDFKFMEMRQRLRERPTGEEAARDRFCLGEHYFRQGMFPLAADILRPLHSQAPRTREELLASVYLLRCAAAVHDDQASALLEKELQDTLSSRQFIGTFRPEEVQRWQSPMGNHYVFREEVDRMEILLNDEPFYTIDLS